MPRRTAEQAEETRAAILAAARNRFAVDGFNASLANIVSDAGVTKGALFHHFPNKLALFREVWTDLQRSMRDEAVAEARRMSSEQDPYIQFLSGARVYLKWAARPEYFKIVLYEGPVVLGVRGWFESNRDLGYGTVRDAMQALAERGRIDAKRVEPYSVLVRAALNGAGIALAEGVDGLTPEEVYDAFETMIRNLR
ncbi:MAG TPA: TetR family transcriptional regulator [Hyphomonas sp.]|nr:TetR family transcriptional regulator [Hyphomonas sp.]HRX73076.1 TetR family transcriptional regulator [Hyphomonas sp.]